MTRSTRSALQVLVESKISTCSSCSHTCTSVDRIGACCQRAVFARRKKRGLAEGIRDVHKTMEAETDVKP